MREETDRHTGKKWIVLSKEETIYGFLAQCVEAVAEAEKSDYAEMLERMEKADMTQGYIIAHYDVLHTESMDNIITELRALLHKRESEKNDRQCLIF